MTRLPRPALTLLAGLALVVAACGGSSATPTPPPDPQALLAQAEAKLITQSVTSFHLNLDLSGKVNASAFAGSTGSGANLDLTGTNLAGDVDVKNQAADLKFTAPAFGPIASGEVIVADKAAYYKIGALGNGKFTKTDMNGLGSLGSSLGISLPISIPSMGAAPSMDIAGEMAKLQQQIKDLDITITLAPDDQVAGQAAYHLVVNIPVDKINALASPGTGSSMKLDSLSVDFWLYKDSSLPAKLDVKAASSSFGNVELVLTISDYNKSVSISAPPADQVQG